MRFLPFRVAACAGVVWLLAAASPASACSLAPADFGEAAWADTGLLVTVIGSDVVTFDLATGTTTGLVTGFFPRVAADPGWGRTAVAIQEGLDSMCGGERFLDVYGIDSNDRLHRLPGGAAPLVASGAGIVAGETGLQTFRFMPWDAPLEARVIETGLPDDPYAYAYGYGAALRDDGELLVAAAGAEGRLRFIAMSDGGAWRDWDPVTLPGTMEARVPAVAFEPGGTRVAVAFSADGRDRVAVMDTAVDPAALNGVLNATTNAGSDDPIHVAWLEDALVMGHGRVIRHIPLEGAGSQATLGSREGLAQLVADPFGGAWAVLTTDRGEAQRVLHFVDAGRSIMQWQREGDAWGVQNPTEWTQLGAGADDGDPVLPPPQGGDEADDATGSIPAPLPFAALAVVLLLLRASQRARRVRR